MSNLNVGKKNKNIYGECCECGAPLEPVWFTEYEYKVIKGHMYKTGRKRIAVDSLVCPYCLHVECVDDSFDGPWHL